MAQDTVSTGMRRMVAGLAQERRIEPVQCVGRADGACRA
jgi:hypothetical protein